MRDQCRGKRARSLFARLYGTGPRSSGSRIEVDIGYTGLAIGRLEVTITLEGGQV